MLEKKKHFTDHLGLGRATSRTLRNLARELNAIFYNSLLPAKANLAASRENAWREKTHHRSFGSGGQGEMALEVPFPLTENRLRHKVVQEYGLMRSAIA